MVFVLRHHTWGEHAGSASHDPPQAAARRSEVEGDTACLSRSGLPSCEEAKVTDSRHRVDEKMRRERLRSYCTVVANHFLLNSYIISTAFELLDGEVLRYLTMSAPGIAKKQERRRHARDVCPV